MYLRLAKPPLPTGHLLSPLLGLLKTSLAVGLDDFNSLSMSDISLWKKQLSHPPGSQKASMTRKNPELKDLVSLTNDIF